MRSATLRFVLLSAFALAAYLLTEWGRTCERCAAIRPMSPNQADGR
jgi:hypothetical protein